MKLSQLFENIEIRNINKDGAPDQTDWGETRIGSIHYSAQDVKPGGVFVAVCGFSADGHDFVSHAVSQGARVVVCQAPVTADAIVIQVDDSRKALAQMAANFYGNPSDKLFIIGVTGTNGKTTITYLLEQIFEKAGSIPGVIGTINYRYCGKVVPNPVTTPESLDLQRILWEMQKAGVTHVIMEVSSHALALHRVHGCRIRMGIFTNLTQDHLDFHNTMEAYWEDKKRLFTEHLNTDAPKERIRAVINCDDRRGRTLHEALDYPRFGVGRSAQCDIRPSECHQDLNGTTAVLSTPEGPMDIRSSLVGRFNLENILCTVGAGLAAGITPEKIAEGIAALPCTPGRLESVPNKQARHIYVDYAHTPDALENVLTTLETLVTGRLITVFGCGGDRDNSKRPRMGEIAARHSDLAVITSDNPRTEDPLKIIEEILPGVKRIATHQYTPADLGEAFKEKGFTVIEDRSEAIHRAIGLSAPGDAILIAGKGHETYQILKDKTIDFDDRLVSKAALSALDAGPVGPAKG